MTFQLPQKLKRELAGVIEYGYSSPKSFVEDAILHRIFELRKEGFSTTTKSIRKVMKRKGISESGILKDFEKKRSS